MTQSESKPEALAGDSVTPLSDHERIDLIANLLLDYLDEEQSGEEGSCKTTPTKML